MIDFRYRPDVDGLRAVAVILVLLFHADLGFSGGFIGVDVFFVLSGFLITGLILKEQEAEKFKLANFWIRRIRRIIPAANSFSNRCSCCWILCAIAGRLRRPWKISNRPAVDAVQCLLLAKYWLLRWTG